MLIATYRLGIELTQRCNLDCKHCFRGNARNVNITREILEKVFDEVKFVQILDLSGGEVFLGYEELKMLLDIAKEKDVTIRAVSMLINGTIYDERIYDLLNQYGDNYQIAISCDDYHEASIERIYDGRTCVSDNPALNPANAKDVVANIKRHTKDKHFVGFQRVSKHLIDNGRALFLSDAPKKAFEASGYYYEISPDGFMLAGPSIFIGADGYISDINSDSDKRNIQSIGNIKSDRLSTSIMRGGIKMDFVSVDKFYEDMQKRELDFGTHKGDHLIFQDNKMAYTTYEPDLKYMEAAEQAQADVERFRTMASVGKSREFLATWDPIYDGDLSQIEHSGGR